jgi:methionyl-tRNA formyltransferase
VKIGLFAAKTVGFEIAKFLGETSEGLSCLVVDRKEDHKVNDEIIIASKVKVGNIFYSDEIYDNSKILELHKLCLDIIVLAWWPYIIKNNIIEIPRIGCLNFHPSLLPFNRGKHYNFWTLVEDTPFGVTLHFVDKGIDSGDIVFQSVIPKTWEDTGESLYYKAQQELVRLFIRCYPTIMSGNIVRTPQDLTIGSYHSSDEIESASQIHLDKNYTARTLLNILRARTFLPHPGAWFIDNGEKYEIRIAITKAEETNNEH